MKHFYCGRLTAVVLEDIHSETTAWDLQGTSDVQTLVVVHTSDVTEEVLEQALKAHPTVDKILITTHEGANYEGWEVIVVTMITLPLIQSVLEG